MVTAAVGADGVHVSVPSMVVAVVACQQQQQLQQQQQDRHIRRDNRDGGGRDRGEGEGKDGGDVIRREVGSGRGYEGVSGVSGGRGRAEKNENEGEEEGEKKGEEKGEEGEAKDDNIDGDDSGFNLPWIEAVLVVSALCNQATVQAPAIAAGNANALPQPLALTPSQAPIPAANHRPPSPSDRFTAHTQVTNGVCQPPPPPPPVLPPPTVLPPSSSSSLSSLNQAPPIVVGGNTTDRVVLQVTHLQH